MAVTNADGSRTTAYLGPYGSAESKEKYAELVKALGRGEPAAGAKAAGGQVARAVNRSVNEVLLAYLLHADTYYRGPDGKVTAELDHIKTALRVVRVLFGETPAADFGLVKLAERTAHKRKAAVNKKLCEHHEIVGEQLEISHVTRDGRHYLQPHPV